jgi:hypothetical protein
LAREERFLIAARQKPDSHQSKARPETRFSLPENGGRAKKIKVEIANQIARDPGGG